MTSRNSGASELDLTRCDREPIHVPGRIQPHGCLFVVDPDSWVIVQAAGDTARLLSAPICDLPATPVTDLLGQDQVRLVHGLLTAPSAEPLFLGSQSSHASSSTSLDLTAHVSGGLIVVEVEPNQGTATSAAEALGELRRMGLQLQAPADLTDILEIAAREVRLLTGFDRVMIYRFLEDETGAVVAEAAAPGMGSFLNHRYPASDIPRQARELYVRNVIRVIPDVGYEPALLVPEIVPGRDGPLDMSDCILRSVSPVHVQYLKNMDVAASMSVSIVIDGSLWGLIAGHHRAPRLVPFAEREICKQFAQMLSNRIKTCQESGRHREHLHILALQDQCLSKLAAADSLDDALSEHLGDLKSAMKADGVALIAGDQVLRAGVTPSDGEVLDLAAWLAASDRPGTFVTTSLSREYERAAAYAGIGSGLLAATISVDEPIMLMWFRAEHIETINWAGNPHKPAEPSANLGLLNPRRSFEVWNETVRQTARPWSQAQVEATERLIRALSDLWQQCRLRELYQQLEKVAAEREVLLGQKDLLIREVHHRVQNSLQIVSSMLQLQARSVPDNNVTIYLNGASQRITAISKVHQHLWQGGRFDSVDLASYLKELCDELARSWGSAWERHIRFEAETARVETDRAVPVALILVELLTNAAKYAYRGEPGPIEVTVITEGFSDVSIGVRDHGSGIPVGETEGTGLGTRLVRSLAAQLGGHVEVTTASPGTLAVLRFPVAEQD